MSASVAAKGPQGLRTQGGKMWISVFCGKSGFYFWAMFKQLKVPQAIACIYKNKGSQQTVYQSGKRHKLTPVDDFGLKSSTKPQDSNKVTGEGVGGIR